MFVMILAVEPENKEFNNNVVDQLATTDRQMCMVKYAAG